MKILAAAALAASVLASPALAQDMEGAWGGAYLYALGGYGTATDQDHYNALNDNRTDLGEIQGGMLGAGVGYDFNHGPFLLGIEADFAKSFIDSDLTYCLGNGLNRSCSASVDFLATARGRFGVAFGEDDHIQLYATGGVALSNVELSSYPTGGNGPYVSDDKWQASWTAGAGIEVAWPDHSGVSTRLEYLYVDIPDDTYAAGNLIKGGPRPLGYSAGVSVVRLILSMDLN